MKNFLTAMVITSALSFAAQPAVAACSNTTGFDRWLQAFRSEAKASGISGRALAALDDLSPDQGVLSRDRGQSVFAQGFFEFSDRMVNKGRLSRGKQLITKYRPIFTKIENEFGVPAPIIVAFWGLETDFGSDSGKLSTIRSVATLAWDCRRPDKFRAELLDALRIIDRGDMRPDELRGTWAGEIGQTQFVPSVYYKYAVDYDGDGKRDLIHSVPDVLASTANYLKALGWRAGEPWLEEVRVPESMDWSQADISIQHPLSKWTSWGVSAANGEPLKDTGVPASLVLPLGRTGPAFLAYRNFQVYTEWNQSLLYATTAAFYAARLAGAPAITYGREAKPFSLEQTKELQRLLVARGYTVGEVDGKIGSSTRASVREAQKKFGLPADSYPTAELLRKLQGGGRS